MDLDTNDTTRQPKTKRRKLNEEKQPMAGTEVSIEVKKVKQAFINTNNIQQILGDINPFGIDLSSGVEKELGIKDNRIINNFIEKLKYE